MYLISPKAERKIKKKRLRHEKHRKKNWSMNEK